MSTEAEDVSNPTTYKVTSIAPYDTEEAVRARARKCEEF